MKAQDKEFQGKSLDEAISAACSYFDLPREKLEIEILSDSKAGIFGLVGAKKARVTARPAPSLETFSVSLQMEDDRREAKEPRQNKKEGKENSRRRGAPAPEAAAPPEPAAAPSPATEAGTEPRPQMEPEEPEDGQTSFPSLMADNNSNGGQPAPGRGRQPRPERGNRSRRERAERGNGERNRGRRGEQPAAGLAEAENDGARRERRQPRRDNRPREETRRNRTLSRAANQEKEAETEDIDNDQRMAYEGLPEVSLAELDAEKLLGVTREAMSRILAKLCPEAGLTVTLGDERVDVSVDNEDAAALLIGREGQTLAAMQYLLTRIVGRSLNAAVNIHLDISAYRQRQDDKLRELSKQLAERVRASGRPQFTRPLSSYHRRIVHMTLQDEADLVTRSKGEGPLKRVSVALK